MLDGTDYCPQPNLLEIGHLSDQFYMSPNFSFSQTMKRMIAFKVHSTMEEKLKTEYFQAAEEALKDMLKTGYATMSTDPKDVYFQYIEDAILKMDFKGILDDLFIKETLERWSETLESIEDFTRIVLH